MSEASTIVKKGKYILWWFPQDWADTDTPHWIISAVSDSLDEIYYERINLERVHKTAQTMITRRVISKVVEQ